MCTQGGGARGYIQYLWFSLAKHIINIPYSLTQYSVKKNAGPNHIYKTWGDWHLTRYNIKIYILCYVCITKLLSTVLLYYICTSKGSFLTSLFLISPSIHHYSDVTHTKVTWAYQIQLKNNQQRIKKIWYLIIFTSMYRTLYSGTRYMYLYEYHIIIGSWKLKSYLFSISVKSTTHA